MKDASILISRTSREIVSIQGVAGMLLSDDLLQKAKTLEPSELIIGSPPIPSITVRLVPEDAGDCVRMNFLTAPPLDEIVETIDCAKYTMNGLGQGIGLVRGSELLFGNSALRSLWTAESMESFRPEGWRVVTSDPVGNDCQAVLTTRLADDIPVPRKGATTMLNQFLERMFDARFYVDKDLRISSNDASLPRLRAMIGCEETLEGRAIESLMPLEIDKVRFREKFIPRLSKGDVRCVTFRTRFLLVDKMLAEVKLFVVPTFVDEAEPVTQETLKQHIPQGNEFPWSVVKLAAAQNPSKYLIGLRLTGNVSSNPLTPEEIAEAASSVGSDISGPESRRRHGHQHRISLEQVPEHSESELSSDPMPAVELVITPLVWSRQQAAAVSVERALTRDVFYSMGSLEDKGGELTEWLVPGYDMSDMEVVQDELLRTLPAALQYHFMHSAQRYDFNRCCELLSHSVFGCLNPVDKAFASCRDMDVMNCSFRFLVTLTTRMPGMAAFKALASLGELIPGLPDLLGQQAGQVAQLQHTLASLAVGIQHPKVVNIHELRALFSEALKLRETTGTIRSQRLPSLYYLCLLWACLMRILGRAGEALPVLVNLFEDMQNYCKRHPLLIAVCKMIGICAHNLAVSALEQNDLVSAFNWIYHVQAVISEKRVQLPPRCQRLVAWAEATQAKVQLSVHPTSLKGG